MKTTSGKAALERVLLGDRERAEAMVQALSASEPVERYTHGFHTGPAGLHPDAARDLIALFPGDSVLDPFVGGGTILVEGRAAGRKTFGRDLSSIAIRIARARTSSADEALLTRMRSASRKITEAAQKSTLQPPEAIQRVLEQWYAPYVLSELEAIRQGVLASEPDIRPLLETVFSSILVKVSWRKSDTSAQREKHHRPPGTASILFHKKARELGRRIADLRAVVPEGTPEAEIRRFDARQVSLKEQVDLVLTSPPYPSTYDYLPMQHLRRVWLEEREEQDALEVGARRLWRDGERAALKRWRSDTETWMKAAASNLRPGGHLVIVIGDGFTPAGPIDSSEPTELGARAAGLTSVARASVERPDHARGTVRWEHAFAYQKP